MIDKITKAMLQGKIFLVGECRGAKVEVVRYVDKKTGQSCAFTSLKILVERADGTETVQVSQFLARGEMDPQTVKIPTERGKAYAFELSGLESRSGFLSAKMQQEASPIPV